MVTSTRARIPNVIRINRNTAAILQEVPSLQGKGTRPLVADLASRELEGRYWALSSGSWELGYVVGPAIGGFILAAAPLALWPLAALVCVLAAVGALGLERAIPRAIRLTPAYELP